MKTATWERLATAAVITASMAAALTVAMVGIDGCSSSKAGAAGAGQANQEATASVVTVGQKDLSDKLQIASEFMPYQSIDVDAEVSGYVKRLYIDWGTRVKAGQLMAVLDVPQLNASVERDKASVAGDQSNVLRAQRMLAQAQATYFVNNVTYQRYADVLKTNPQLISQQEVDVAHGSQLRSAAGVSAAEASVSASQQALSADRASLDRDKAMYEYSFIRAPFSGVVTTLNGYIGALLPASTSNSTASLPLCHLSQLDRLRLVIPVPEMDVPDVRVGETVNVSVPSLHRVFQGKISLVAGQINFETRTEHTEVEVHNPGLVLVPGMYADVELPTKTASNALVIPIQAVSLNPEGTAGTVLVVTPQNRIEPRKVTIGVQTAYEVQIVSGLRAGERVVFGDQEQYHAGETVQPQAADLASLGAKQG